MLACLFAYIAAKIETISEVKPYHADGDGLIWESGRVGNRHLQEGKQKCLPVFFLSYPLIIVPVVLLICSCSGGFAVFLTVRVVYFTWIQ